MGFWSQGEGQTSPFFSRCDWCLQEDLVLWCDGGALICESCSDAKGNGSQHWERIRAAAIEEPVERADCE